MKNLTLFVVLFASCVCYIQITASERVRYKSAFNLTALQRIKNHLSRVANTIANLNLKKRLAQDVVLDVYKLEFARQSRKKRKVGRDNLDDLYPALAIRSVNVNLDWTNLLKTMTNASAVIGSSLVLSDGTRLVSHVMKTSSAGNYYTISSLEQNRVYRGEIKLLSEKEEAKNFIRKKSNGKNVEEFELTTPFIVAGT